MGPYYFLEKRERVGSEEWDAFFGIRLSSCPALRAGEPAEDRHSLWRVSQQVDFIYALHNLEPPRTYAVRYISNPNPEEFLSGTLEVVLITKVSASSENNASALAEYLFQETLVLLGSMLPDYSWRVIDNEDDFQRAWSPFDLEGAYVAEIRRREDEFQVGSIMGRISMLGEAKAGAEKGPDRIYFVHQYIPRRMAFTRFLRAMLLYPEPLLVQVNLAPTSLEETEERKLVADISRCEKYLAHGHSETSLANQSISHQQASMVTGLLWEQLVRLQDAPFLINISIASPRPLQRHIVEALGVEITLPVGGLFNVDSRLAQSVKGGCDVVYPETDDDYKAARLNVSRLGFEIWGYSPAPPELARLRNLVDANEAVAAFRFPIAGPEGLVGLESQTSRVLPPPKEVVDLPSKYDAEQLMLIGENHYLGFPTNIFMLQKDRHQHVYIVGQTGTGKTTLLKTMILSDMEKGHGLALIDPHGDLFEEILGLIPESRLDDVVILDPSDDQYVVGFNILEVKDDEDKHFVVREMKSIVERLMYDQYGPSSREFAGPVFYQGLQNGLLLVMSDPDKPATMLDFYKIFMEPDYYKRWYPLKVENRTLEQYENTLERISNALKTGSTSNDLTMGEYIASKFEDFVFDPRLSLILNQRRSIINFGKIMDENKILLVNLAKGLLTETNSRFLGRLIMTKLQMEAMKRVKLPPEQRSPFFIYVDEFQSIVTSNFTMLLSEGRKFGIGLVLANQFVNQITDQQVRESIFGNVGTIICFRIGQVDSHVLEPHFRPAFDAFDLTNLPNWNACVKMCVRGQVVRPFSMSTVLPKREPDDGISSQAIERSRSKFAVRKEKVEKALRD
jgi:hypothetical protein